ncbi:MAG: hypothetical protein P1U89_08545 [Verrucomicrobiales bacterium]|nr:hypothetical protein [Verrucomicrobiales bacterium]
MKVVHHERFSSLTKRVRRLPVGIFLGVVAATFLISSFARKPFTARSSVQIKKTELAGFDFGTVSAADFNSTRFLNDAAQSISDRTILEATADKLSLVNEWQISEADVMDRLKRSMSTQVDENSRTIEICYTAANRKEAIMVANALGEALVGFWQAAFSGQEMIELIRANQRLVEVSAEVKAEGFALLNESGADQAALLSSMEEWEQTKARSMRLSKRLESIYAQTSAVQESVRMTQKASIANTVAVPRFSLPLLELCFATASIVGGVSLAILSLRNNLTGSLEKAPANQVRLRHDSRRSRLEKVGNPLKLHVEGD